jgi:hypothetical protein
MVIRRLVRAAATFSLAIVMAGCGADGSSSGASIRIDYIAGAIEPVLTRSEYFVIEGFGFGADPGSVVFTRLGGGTIEQPIADSAWTPFAIATTVPDSAARGHVSLGVQTAAGTLVTAIVNIVPRGTIDPATLAWTSRGTFPGPSAGVALAAAQFPAAGGILRTSLYAAGGAEPPQMTPDSGVGAFVARVTDGGAGAIGTWQRGGALPAPRAFAAAAVGTRFNSRFRGMALYVIGGIDSLGKAQATVYGADITADAITGNFVPLEPLPAPRAGALAVVHHGRIYVFGGTDSAGRPQTTVYMGRVGIDGHIDGWFAQPPLIGPRAYGAAIIRSSRVFTVGGVADSVPAGGGLDSATQRLVTGDTAAVSALSGFFTGAWGAGPALLPEGRSQFALLDLDSTLLVVGGMYAGASAGSAETLSASVIGDSIGAFGGPAGTNRIADLMCGAEAAGTLVGPAGITWQEPDGTRRGLVLGGVDLATQGRRNCAWGF